MVLKSTITDVIKTLLVVALLVLPLLSTPAQATGGSWWQQGWWHHWWQKDQGSQCVSDESDIERWQWQSGHNQFTLNGDAVETATSLRLTDAEHQAAAVFWKTPLPLYTQQGKRRSFSAAFSFKISNPSGISDRDGQGGDGLTFVINASDQELGQGGGGLGYRGLRNSVAVEFDTFNDGWWDRHNGNHVGLNRGGRVRSKHARRIDERLNDGDTWYAWVDYQGDKRRLELRLAKTPVRPIHSIMSKHIEIPWWLGGSRGYVGFTAATGDAGNQHEILSFDFVNTDAPIGECEPPEFVSEPLESAVAGTAYQYLAQAEDPTPGDSLTYRIVTGPAGMSIDAGSGLVSWLPSAQDFGEHAVELEVSDSVGLTDRQSFVITVVDNNSCEVEGTHSVKYDRFDDLSAWQLNGVTPSLTPNRHKVLRLTKKLWQSGSAFLKDPIPMTAGQGFNASFSAAFGFKISHPIGISDQDGKGADGLVFVVQTMDSNVGGIGGSIGYGGIQRSLGIEFDTWNNGNIDNHNGNHIGINVDGSLDSISLLPISQRLNNGHRWYAWVDYDGNLHRLEIRLSSQKTRPQQPTLVRENIDLPAILQNENAFVGFTSGTGAAGGKHDVFEFEFTNSMAQGDCPELVFSSTPPTEIVTGAQLSYQTEVSGADDNAVLSYSIVTGPAGATIDQNGLLLWTATGLGETEFVLRVESDSGESAEQSFSVNVLPPLNQAPIANNLNALTNEDTPLAITLVANDADGDPLTYQVLTQPNNGALSGTAPDLIYTPNANFNGSDSFTYRANDGALDSNTATVSITVIAINDAPVAQGQNISIDQDNSASGQLSASDNDSGSLTFNLAQQAGLGNVVIQSNGQFTYTPNPNVFGSDSFQFVANDGALDSNLATVNITINPVNDAPAAMGQSVTTDEDQSLNLVLGGSDIDGDALSFEITSQPANGTLSGTPPNISYQPAADFNGADSFTFVANDGALNSTAATINITVNPLNDAPIAVAQSVMTNEDTPLAITLTGSDTDGDALSFTVSTDVTNGTLTGTPPDLTYTPNLNFSGVDSFEFFVNDGSEDSPPAQVTIDIAPVNDPPEADPQSVATDEDTPIAITLTGSDADGDTLSFSIDVDVTNGALTGTPPDLTYTPNPDFNGSDSFEFNVSDGVTPSTSVPVSIDVSPVNDAPTADGQLLSTPEDPSLAIVLSGQDADGDSLSFNISSAPANGTITGTPPNINYQPASNFFGSDQIEFTASDGTLLSTEALIQIDVIAVNDVPSIDSTPITTGQVGQIYTYQLDAGDAEGDALTYDVVTGPIGLSIDADGLVTWNPTPVDVGTHPVNLSVTDTNGDSTTQSYELVIDPAPNTAPVITSTPITIATVGQDYSYIVVANDADGDTLSYGDIALPNGMSLDPVTGELTWTPGDADIGAHLVSVLVDDGEGGSASQEFTLTVIATDLSNAAYLGTEFWIPRYNSPENIQLVIHSEINTSGVVDILGNEGQGQIPFSTRAGQITLIDVPVPIFEGPGPEFSARSGLRGWSVNVTSDDPISVRVIYFEPAGSDALLALPVRAMGTEYITSNLGGSPTGRFSRAVMIANEDNTQVTITAARHLEIDGVPILPGEQYTLTLNRGEDFHLKPLPFGHDISGTIIDSDKPIGVYSGHDCAYVQGVFCNMLIEQLPSVAMWKNEYLTAPLRSRYGDVFRVNAATDNTTVLVNGVVQGVINRGEFLEYILDVASVVSADNPIQVTQHSTGYSYDQQTRMLDPFWDVRTQATIQGAFWGEDQLIEIDPAPAPNWAFVIVPTPNFDDLVIDGVPVDPDAFGHRITWPQGGIGPNPAPISVAQIALSPGVHRFTAPVRFGLYKNTEGMYNYADPSMVVVPATDNYLSAYTFQSPGGNDFSRHFINITVPTSAINNVMLDGQVIDPAHFFPLGASTYSYARIGVNIGGHYISADEPFGLLVYGFGDADAYTYPGGWALNQNQVTDSLTVVPDNPTPVINNPVCVDITALDAASDAIPFAQIELSIAGANPDQLTITANQSGNAQHCYEGIFIGVDLISAQSGAVQQSAQIDWLADAGNDAPAITSEPVVLTPDGAAYRYSMMAFDADGDILTYSLAAGPAGMTIDSVTGVIDWNATFGTYAVSVVVNDPSGAADQQDYQLVVNRAPVIDILPIEMIVSDYMYVSRILATDPDGDTLYYRLEQGSAEFIIDGRSGDISSIGPLAMGNYPITISISDRKGGVIFHSYTLLVSGVNNPPTLTAAQTVFTALAGDTADINLTAVDPDGDEVLIRIISSNLPGLTLNATTGQGTWISALEDVGNYQVTVVAIDEWGASSAPLVMDFTVTENLPPQILSSAPTVAYVGVLFEYQMIVDDPENRPLTYEIAFHPGFIAEIDSNGLMTLTPPGYTLGTSRFMTIRVTDSGGHAVTQTFFFEVREPNLFTPQLEGGLPFQAIVGFPLSFQLAASDGDGDTVTFSLQNGPTGMTVSSAGLIDWTPDPSQVGFQDIVVRLSDGDRELDVNWQIETLANPLPLVTNILVDPQFITPGENAQLTVQLLGGIDPQIDSVTLDGAPITLVNNQATITSNTVGRHDIVVNVLDDGEIMSFTTFLSVTDPTDVDPPVVDIESPEEGAEITDITSIVGTVSDANLVDVYLYAQRVGSDDIIDLYRGDDAFASEPIADLDPTLLRNGQYRITLQAFDANAQGLVTFVNVVVTGGTKIGNFSITIEDLNIPMAGIPIQVSRTYDSRRKHEDLDFGHGWSIDYQNISVEESNNPTAGWFFSQEFKLFTINGVPTSFLVQCMRSTNNKTVTVTLPNDDVEEFTVRLDGVTGTLVADNDPDCNLTASTFFDLFFDPVEGTTSTLEAYDNQNLFLTAAGNLVDDIIEVIPAVVSKYRLTTKTGFVYNLDQDFGIESVVDPNGNTLTYSDTGISHSAGKSVLFNRDTDGRITSITDPMGMDITYGYSTQGDLVAVTDREGNTSTFEYDGEHGLTDMYDALGRRLLKNFYDEDGRLTAQEDSDGNRTDFLHNLGARTSIVTDRLGRVTQFGYDVRGNVETEVDALGNLTTYTHDANDNQLSQTDALGNTSIATYDDQDNQLTQTDELGRVTSFTYNEFGKEVDTTDPKGNTYQNTYDGVGNLIGITDPDGNLLGANLLNSQGLVTQLADTFDNFTFFTYDGDGNKLTETDALGNVTTMTYDGNGNVLTETVQRTVNGLLVDETTSFQYDALDRLIATTDPLGNISQMVYDAVGNKAQDIDALGRATSYTYDAYRRLTRTDYPDGTFITMSYDAEGNLLSETDANGNTTSYAYDALDRPITTTYADGSTTQTAYDAIGRVISETDERGNVTTLVYDAAGQRIQTTDALGNVTTMTYDANGNLGTMTDARGNTFQYAYDIYDNRTVTTWPDGSTSSDSYDRKGRLTGQTDQNGNGMTFAYDALDRLNIVTDALTNNTQYGYDEVGNKVTQTDAENRVTIWTYDALGRELTRTLPLSQQEVHQYDAVGNRIQMTDFNGQVTLFAYDSRDRLISATYHDATTETFSYDSHGNRTAAIDRNGQNQNWTYDNRHRLIQVVDAASNQIDYSYDVAGNKTQQITSPDNSASSITTSYSYDALNRLATVTDADSQITAYGYDANGNRETVSYPNGHATAYVYDVNNRLTRQTTEDSSAVLIADYQYTLDPSGHRLQIDELGGRSTTYTYDNSYKLLTEAITDAVNGNHNAVYFYDNVGNRTDSTINGVSTMYTYDDNDRLQQQGGEVFTYDDNGNTRSKTIDGFISSYSYDAKNLLASAQLNDAGVITNSSYDYNVDGIRLQKTEGGTTVDYLIDPNHDNAQVIRETNQTTLVDIDYLHGDDLIQQSQGSSNERYYIYDGLGSTRLLSNSIGVITDSYDYEVFGSVLNQSGITENNYQFTGEQYDPALDQYYLRARYYDPNTARFTQMDTWMGNNSDPLSLHKYLYSGSDPVNHVDPSGHFFSLGSVGAANNIQGILSATATVSFARSLQTVAVGLIGAGLGAGISEELKDFIAANAPAMNQILEEKRTFARDAVKEKARGRKILYHYSSRGAVLSIAATGVGQSSAGFGRGRPPGFYASSITPWSIQYTQRELSALFYGGDITQDVSWFVAIDGESFLQYQGNSSEHYMPSNTGFTDLEVITIGPNLMLP